jgi:ornithine carbamoyltransferase
VTNTTDASEAVHSSDVVVTDMWGSMGQDEEEKKNIASASKNLIAMI